MSINPALAELRPLVGHWRMELYNAPFLQDPNTGIIGSVGYRMTFEAAHWQMWRDTPEFSQRFDAHLRHDARIIQGRWEKSTDQGATWQHDFNVDYLRDPTGRGRSRRRERAFAAQADRRPS
jgi:hypothetical protein